MEIKKITAIEFTTEEEKALELVYDMFDNACDARDEEKGCCGCPLFNNCPLGNGNRLQTMKNFIRKIAD